MNPRPVELKTDVTGLVVACRNLRLALHILRLGRYRESAPDTTPSIAESVQWHPTPLVAQLRSRARICGARQRVAEWEGFSYAGLGDVLCSGGVREQ